MPGVLPSILWDRLRRFNITPCDFVQWLKHNMHDGIPLWRLQSIVVEALGRQRQALAAHCRPRDLSTQPFEFVALISFCGHAGMQREPMGSRCGELVIARIRESLQGERFTPGMRAERCKVKQSNDRAARPASSRRFRQAPSIHSLCRAPAGRAVLGAGRCIDFGGERGASNRRVSAASSTGTCTDGVRNAEQGR